MPVIITNCCLCGKVRDDEGSTLGQGPWVSLTAYRARHHQAPEEIWFSHTYCPDCTKAYREFLFTTGVLDRPQQVQETIHTECEV